MPKPKPLTFEQTPEYKELFNAVMVKALAECLYPNGCPICGQSWDGHAISMDKQFDCPSVQQKTFRGLRKKARP